MITINDLNLMNETLINYYTSEEKNEKKLLKHRIIREILNKENCFLKISKENAINILIDIGIKECCVEETYSVLCNK